MMFVRNFSVSGERSLQHFDVLHIQNIEPTPSRQTTAALPADLPRKQTRNPFLNAVVMRFDDPFFVLVPETNQPLSFDCAVHQLVQFRIDCDSNHRPLFPDESLRQQTPMCHLFSKVIGLLPIDSLNKTNNKQTREDDTSPQKNFASTGASGCKVCFQWT